MNDLSKFYNMEKNSDYHQQRSPFGLAGDNSGREIARGSCANYTRLRDLALCSCPLARRSHPYSLPRTPKDRGYRRKEII